MIFQRHVLTVAEHKIVVVININPSPPPAH